jgi:hypothetical protein
VKDDMPKTETKGYTSVSPSGRKENGEHHHFHTNVCMTTTKWMMMDSLTPSAVGTGLSKIYRQTGDDESG